MQNSSLELKMIKCGLIVQSYEGIERIEELPFYRNVILREIYPEELRDFLILQDKNKEKIAEDTGFIVSDDYIAELFHEREKFLKKYPNSRYNKTIFKWDKQLIQLWLGDIMDNMRVVDHFTKKVRPELLESLRKFTKKYPDSRYTPLFTAYLKFLENKNYGPTHQEIRSFFKDSQELRLIGISDLYSYEIEDF